MNSQFKGLPFFAAALVLVGSFFLSCYALFNTIVTIPFTQFSLMSSVLPLSGLGGIGCAGFVTMGRILLTVLMNESPLSATVYYIPTLCASASWAVTSRFYAPFLSLLCMALFIAHPVGAQASVYTLYWLIPLALTFLPRTIIFARSLTSTFIAHAVGSVLFLYWGPITTASYWMALIPVVAFERFAFALVMTAAYYAGSYALRLVNSFITRAYLRAAQ